MNNYPQELYETVQNILEQNIKARNSDIELYRVVLERFYGTCDLNKINLKADIFASLKRCRQKIQEKNPFLGPCDEVKEYRQEVEQTYLDFVRNY